MLTHLPGRMSQPSRKGVTSNIFILRCSFHKTAKRLSITSLTRLLRLHTKIQSNIVRHIHQKFLQQNNVLVIQTCDFATTKTKKKGIRSITKTSKPTLNCQSSLTILVFQMTIKHKKNHGLDYFIETNFLKAPNYLEQ